MLPKINRLKKDRDFKKVYKYGKKISGSFFIIRYKENNLLHSRFGIVISSSVIKKAAKRNYYRRRISEIIRINLGKIKKGYDVVFLVFKTEERFEREKIEREIISVMKKISEEDNKNE